MRQYKVNKDRVFAAAKMAKGEAGAGIKLLFARFMPPMTMLRSCHLTFDARNTKGPQFFDLGAISMPLDFNSVTLAGAANDTAVLAEANRALNLTNLIALLSYHTIDEYDVDGGGNTGFTLDTTDDGADTESLQSFFTLLFPRKVHSLRAHTTSIWGFDSLGAPLASKLGGQWAWNKPFWYGQPSVFMIFCRRAPALSSDSDGTGSVWNADGGVPSDFDEDTWRAIMSQEWREALTPSELEHLQQPWRAWPHDGDNIFLSGSQTGGKDQYEDLYVGLNGYIRTKSNIGYEDAKQL